MVTSLMSDGHVGGMILWMQLQSIEVGARGSIAVPRRYTLRKRQDQKAATRDRIVAAAAELFRVQGVTHTSMAQVAAAADVAPGTDPQSFRHDRRPRDGGRRTTSWPGCGCPRPDIFDGVDWSAGQGHRRSRARWPPITSGASRGTGWRSSTIDRSMRGPTGRARYEAEYDGAGPDGPWAGGRRRRGGESWPRMLGPGVFVALGGSDDVDGRAPLTAIGRVLAPWLEATLVRR